ncbi:GNAT family N-acetyltransferase [Nonomuraea zeae]|uniref:GNAT family N-acetyltransferase n=1 Tax=Nonomuraea zeae TaxID=1642303 RepID=A0A5S4GKS6_9ACTN|nr:GNAT family N-acetyltransferase [Nonomuraea zeae]TMR33568.1 GNAT family N-acetyltransferase [Nonomuraea zeae]
MDDVIRGHAARVRAADPLVAGQDELREPGAALIETRAAAGLATEDRIDPGSMRASWSPLIVHRLQARVSGADPEGALGGLLDRWTAGLRLDEPGQALAVTWPSRDTAPVRALAVRGFAPIAVAGVRRLRERTVSAPAVRRAGEGDLVAVARMYERLVAYDAQFGWVAVRPSTSARIKEFLTTEVLSLEWCWIAEAGGEPVGCVIVQPPARSAWMARAVNVGPVAYLSAMYVEPHMRGQGVAAALTSVAHGHAAAQGATWMTLHHALPNPLSTPFWARQGYRPLLTQWVRHVR